MYRHSYNFVLQSKSPVRADVYFDGLNLPKSRSSKINRFKHYTTDAPV
ncbi:MAG: hypothetical protein RO257_12540 [Candidatus Kapabacteria bacterium]|nr:hypothetical protein [Candidatus Kapabacteria bacterium]